MIWGYYCGFSEPMQNLLRRATRGDGSLDDHLPRGCLFEHHGFEQAVLVSEDLVDRCERPPRPVDNVLEGGPLVPLLREQAARGIDDRSLAAIETAEFGQLGHFTKL